MTKLTEKQHIVLAAATIISFSMIILILSVTVSFAHLGDWRGSAESEAKVIMKVIEDYPADLIYIDYANRIIRLEIGGWMTDPSDATCQATGAFFLKLAQLGYRIYADGEFVPTSRQPIDLALALQLASDDNY